MFSLYSNYSHAKLRQSKFFVLFDVSLHANPSLRPACVEMMRTIQINVAEIVMFVTGGESD